MKPTKITDLKSSYGSVEPDGWAVTRMRARLEAENNGGEIGYTTLIAQIFKRYVLAVSVVLLMFTMALDQSENTISADVNDSELESWLYGDLYHDIDDETVEYTFLIEL